MKNLSWLQLKSFSCVHSFKIATCLNIFEDIWFQRIYNQDLTSLSPLWLNNKILSQKTFHRNPTYFSRPFWWQVEFSIYFIFYHFLTYLYHTSGRKSFLKSSKKTYWPSCRLSLLGHTYYCFLSPHPLYQKQGTLLCSAAKRMMNTQKTCLPCGISMGFGGKSCSKFNKKMWRGEAACSAPPFHRSCRRSPFRLITQFKLHRLWICGGMKLSQRPNSLLNFCQSSRFWAGDFCQPSPPAQQKLNLYKSWQNYFFPFDNWWDAPTSGRGYKYILYESLYH